MQRYSDGLAVPKNMIDRFPALTSDGAGDIAVALTYVPKSIDDIMVPVGWNAALDGVRPYRKHLLTGRVLTLRVMRIRYDKAAAVTGGENGGGTGADPHTHTIGNTTEEVAVGVKINETQSTIVVMYPVA